MVFPPFIIYIFLVFNYEILIFYFNFFPQFLFSEIIFEEGDLVQFFGGFAPNSSYDNWLSHVTEGIAETDYNDYGPDFLDIQKNGFGNYKKLNQNSTTLIYWESIFENFVSGNLNQVDSLLLDSLESFFMKSLFLMIQLQMILIISLEKN